MKDKPNIKIGLLGVGHLGKIHLKCLMGTPFEVVGLYDTDQERASALAAEYGVRAFQSVADMLEAVDAVDIVTPTTTHYDLAEQAMRAGKHCFIEKPVTTTTEEAEKLFALQQQTGLLVQVGHVERYNPAILALKAQSLTPAFIEGHRLAMFNPRGTDVSVVLDLMIHDLDLVLSIVDSEVESVLANGVNIVSKTADICNARIQFVNGCVANLTASRISLKNMRKLRLFQNDAYISLDFLKKETQVVRLENVDVNRQEDKINDLILSTDTGDKRIYIDTPEMKEVNAIQAELSDFYHAIIGEQAVTVPLRDGYRALQLAYRIEEQLSKRD